MIYVLIPVFNRKTLTLECLASFSKQTYKDYEIVVVDDGSTDGSAETIRDTYPEVRILKGPGGWWWAKSLNKGLAQILPHANPEDFVLIINNDVEVKPDYLEKMLGASKAHGRAIVGSFLRDFVTGQEIRKSTSIDWRTFSLKFGENIDSLTTRGILIPIEVFQEIHGFTPLLPHHGADLNFSMQAKRLGFTLVLAREAPVYSKEKPGEKDWLFWTRNFSRRSGSNVGANLMLVWLNAPTLWSKLSCSARIIYRVFKI